MAQAAVSATNPAVEETFQTQRVWAISTGHFIHDAFPAFLAVMLPLIRDKFDLTYAAAGALVTVLRWSSLIQPFVGHLADRTDIRYFVIAAPTVTALGMSLLGVAPSYAAIVALLVLVGFSHAAFHPAAAAMVTRASGGSWGKGMSYFMAGGELGRALGPLLIVGIIVQLGFTWSPIAAVFGVIASFILYLQVGRAPKAVAAAVSASSFRSAVKRQARPLALLAGMIFFRALAATSFATFLPTYFTGLGQTLWSASIALVVYELAGAVGAFFGGTLSDRIGRKLVLIVSQVGSVPLFWLTLNLEQPWSLVVLAFAGLLALSTGPVSLALVQEILPDNRAAASGINFFLGFEGTVVATLIFGFAADLIGLQTALYGSIFLSLISLFFTFPLPDYRRR